MTVIGHYNITETLGANGRYLIYRAKAQGSAETVLIKTLRPTEIEHGDFAQLQYEHGLLQRLGSHNGHFPTVLGWVEPEKPLNLILKDEGFAFLSEVLKQKPLDLEVFFPIAIQLAKMLTEIHNAGIIFKNINPHSIWFRATDKAVQIADFSIATELKRTMVPGDPPRLLQGSLEYIAPEQTGRMNRPLTQAADLYSLGILFYEYLSGSVPFTGTEPMTIIFGHMATVAKDLQECNSSLPKSLCAIVMKLLSKMSEDRYKSALGLTEDLEHAFRNWQEQKEVVFSLGQNDVATRLELPSRLYGREEETEILFGAFDTVCDHKKNALITVSGYSGIGKTSLVRELIPRIVLNKGFLASGKFDKFQQSDTYEGLRQALDKLVRYQLSLAEDEYAAFKTMLLEEMGSILAIITDFVPRLKIIVGEPEALPEVSIEATKNRFELAILRFIKLIAASHPLVLFLDDVQWANTSLFDLLKKLILSEEVQNLLVIASYRSNEVNTEHPLTAFLDAIETRKMVQKIVLEGLPKTALTELLVNMLYLPESEIKFLSNLMGQKTEGNPFFLLMLLEELYKDNCLSFSLAEKRWVWDEERIQNMSLTDNVLDFVAKRIAKLTKETRDSLHLAACIGGTFRLEDLALAKKETALLVAQSLHSALQESLIVPTQLKDEWSEGVSEEELLQREYKFQHDKVQQACYELKPLEETRQIHLELARHWAVSYQPTDAGTRVMAIADQFNKGLAYVVNAGEKHKIAEFNYRAAEFALQSAAYDISYEYGRVAKNLLAETAWQTDYEFCFQVHFSYIQSAFLSRHFDKAQQAAEESLSKAHTNLEKVKLLKLKGDLNCATGAGGSGMVFFEEALRLLGYPNIAKKPRTVDLLWTMIRFKWYLTHRGVPLESLPLSPTAEQEILFSISIHLGEEAYYAGEMLRRAYITMTWVVDTFPEHYQSLRLTAYLYNAILFPHSSYSHALYQQALPFIENCVDSEEKAVFYCVGGWLHAAWYQPWFELIDNFKKAAAICEKVGNLEFGCWSIFYQILFDIKLPLPAALTRLTDLKPRIQGGGPRANAIFSIIQRYLLNLSGGCAFNNWQDENFDGKSILEIFITQKYEHGLNYLYMCQLQTAIQLNDKAAFADSMKNIESALGVITMSNQADMILQAHIYLYLAKISIFSQLRNKEKIKTRIELFKSHRTVKNWIKLCPENFSHCEVLMRAELAGLKGNLKKALPLYDEAIALATEHQVPEYACLAAHRALQLCFDKNQPELTYRYANKAVELYAAWGAFGVVKMLQEKYSFYLTPESKAISPNALSKEDYNARFGLDARSIILATRVINKSLRLGLLLANIMQLLIENIAATRGAFCLLLKGDFWIEAYYASKESGIQTLTHTPWQQAKISQEVFLQTLREKKEILVMDVSKSEEFQGSAYLIESEAKSLISVPIFKGEDEDTVIGVIYCENNLSTDSFTTDRLMVLRALSIQMSMFIDNSRLYTMFERFVPKPFLNQLGQKDIFDLDAGDSVRKDMNVLFMDIRNFTGLSEKHSSEFIFKFINEYLLEVTPLIDAHHGFIDKFLGDGIMALFPGKSSEAVKACVEIQRKITDFAKNKTEIHLEVGMGLHYGSLMLGIVGEATHIEGTVIGDTVNTASRLEALNKMFKTQCLISDAVKKSLTAEDLYHLRPVGKIRLLGREDAMTVWQLLDSIRDDKERIVHIEQLSLFEMYYKAYLGQDFEAARKGFESLLKDNPNDGVLTFYIESCRTYEQTPPPADWQAEIEMRFK